jgi:hypothetical protein
LRAGFDRGGLGVAIAGGIDQADVIEIPRDRAELPPAKQCSNRLLRAVLVGTRPSRELDAARSLHR